MNGDEWVTMNGDRLADKGGGQMFRCAKWVLLGNRPGRTSEAGGKRQLPSIDKDERRSRTSLMASTRLGDHARNYTASRAGMDATDGWIGG
jgi:hypothetical protein